MQLTVVIADDEQLARDEITYLLRQFPNVEVIGQAANGLEAAEMIERLEPDAAFLDVQMPGLDGLGVIRRLKERQANLPYFVLATAFENYAIEAFRLEAIDYLLKPIEKERLAETLERVRRAAGEARALTETTAAAIADGPRSSKIIVRSGARHLLVDTNDVIFATIEDGLITIVTTQFEGEPNHRTIEELQANLDPNVFWRVHRSYLVNINRIREVIPWFKSSFMLKMDDKKGSEIPVSRVQTKRLREMFRL
jgi:two-component system LytT family response regulator/two-component system response regulator LytT